MEFTKELQEFTKEWMLRTYDIESTEGYADWQFKEYFDTDYMAFTNSDTLANQLKEEGYSKESVDYVRNFVQY